MKKTVVVTGSSGVIGSVFLEKASRNYKIICLYANKKPRRLSKIFAYKKINFLEKEKIYPALLKIRPDIVIHLAAMTHIENCEKDKKNGKSGIVWKINVESTQEIVRYCKDKKVHLIYLSTECVFDGKKKFFKENDIKNPKNWYGYTKSEAEELTKKVAKSTIIRSVVAYHKNDDGKTIYGKMLNSYFKTNKIYGVHDQLFTPTCTFDIVKAIISVIEKKIFGILHVAPEKAVSPYEFAVFIAKENNIPIEKVKKVALCDFYPKSCRLRLENACLDSKLSIKRLGFIPKNPII